MASDGKLTSKFISVCFKDQKEVMPTVFSLFAEIERDLVSERTKEGL